MPATITRTVTWTGTNTTSNPDFEWVNVDGVTWVTRADSSTVNQSDFTIADNGTGAVRTSQWEVRHWNYVNDNTLIDSFTITQSAAGVVATTTTTTQAGTTTTTTQAATTTTTTQAATTTTSTTTTAAPTTTTSTTQAPLNGILVTSTNVVTVSEVANGIGGSTYTDDNSSNSASQAVTYRLSLDPDTDLTLSNEVYWSTTIPSTSGHQSTTSPYWASGLSVNNSPSVDEAQISFVHVDPNAGGLGSSAPSTEEQAEAQAGPSGGSLLPANQMYLIARHPDDTSHWVAILVTAPTASITTTTTAAPTPTFYWSVAGGNDGLGTNAGQVYPAHYNGSSGTSGNLSQTVGDPYVAGAMFHLWGEYQLSGVDITSAPTNGWSAYITTPTYINFDTAVWNSTVGMWKFTFNTVPSDPGYPTNDLNDDVANMYNTVSGSSVGYGVIIDATLSCHVTGTVMNLADGSTRLVEDLQVGDVLASYDIAGLSDTGEFLDWSSQINQFSATQTTATVVNITSSSFGRYFNFNNGLTKVTEEHPVLVKDAGNNISFKQVIDVVIGDSFYINGAWVEITSKEAVEETITAYNIDVEADDVYLADGILWHNTENLMKVT